MQSITDFTISICIDYGLDKFTLTDVRFIEKKQNIFISQHLPRNYMQLRNKVKFLPHTTYHGLTGHIHVASYNLHMGCRDVQKIDQNFKGLEPLLNQGFGRNYAKIMGHRCERTHVHLLIPANKIEKKTEIIKDNQGSVTTELPTASFQIDLLEPSRTDLIPSATNQFQQIIDQKLFDQTFPWCLISITKVI